MKKLFVLFVAVALLVCITSCFSSRFYAEDENGNKVLVHDIDVGSLSYYPPMVIWNIGIVWPVTITEFYTCFVLFVPPAILTNNGEFIWCPNLLQKTMGFIVFENHLPLLPWTAIEYEIRNSNKGDTK